MRVYLGLAIAVVLGLAGTLRAEPLDLEQVAADAKWVAHVDADAARASTVAQKAHQWWQQKRPDAERFLTIIHEIWNFDPRTDLHGVTFYGEQFNNEAGAVIVHAKVDQPLLLERVKMAPKHQVSTYGKYELHTWMHVKSLRREQNMTGAFYGPDIVVFGGCIDEVKAALDVLDGTKPNLAGKKDSPLAGAVPQGTILVARAIGLAEAELPCQFPSVKQVDSLALAVGEDQGESFVEGKLIVKQAESAQQIKAIVEGILAAAVLRHTGDAEALKVVNASKVTADDKTVAVEWRVPAEAVWAHAQKLWGKMAGKDWRRCGSRLSCPYPAEKK